MKLTYIVTVIWYLSTILIYGDQISLYEARENFSSFTTTYKIGDTGPLGGMILYDKGNFFGGWRYLEVSPLNFNNTIELLNDVSKLDAMVPALLSDLYNTHIILDWSGDVEVGTQSKLNVVGNKNRFFNGEEFNLMNQDIIRDLSDRLLGEGNWASTLYDKYNSMGLNFKSNNFSLKYKGNTYWVRAVMAF